MILELPNMTMDLSNLGLKNKGTIESNVIVVQSYERLLLSNVMLEPSNVTKKIKGTMKCDNDTVICDIHSTQSNIGTIQCE